MLILLLLRRDGHAKNSPKKIANCLKPVQNIGKKNRTTKTSGCTTIFSDATLNETHQIAAKRGKMPHAKFSKPKNTKNIIKHVSMNSVCEQDRCLNCRFRFKKQLHSALCVVPWNVVAEVFAMAFGCVVVSMRAVGPAPDCGNKSDASYG